jgi:hypothetical protein
VTCLRRIGFTLLAMFLGMTAVGCSSEGKKPQNSSDKSATQILDEAANALRAARSYKIDGMLDPGFVVSISVTKNGSAGTVSSHDLTWQTLAVDGKLWLRGKTMWEKTLGAAAAARYGNAWVLIDKSKDATAAFGYAPPLRGLHEAIPGRLFKRSDLDNKGVRTVSGQQVYHLENDDDIYDVLAEGTPYPLTWFEKENPGPTGQPCGITLSRFDEPATITAPTTTKTLG